MMFFLVIMVTFMMFLAGPTLISGQSCDMSRFKSQIEPDSCANLKQLPKKEEIRSIWYWHDYLERLTKVSDKEYYYMRAESTPDTNSSVLHHIRLDTGSVPNTFSQDKNKPLFQEYIDKYPITYFFPLNNTTVLFVFKMSDKDLAVIFDYKEQKGRSIEIVGTADLARGSIPLLHYDDRFQNHSNLLPTNLINNVDYSYQKGVLGLNPVNINTSSKNYYGFNQDLSFIYFAHEMSTLKENVPNYLPASDVVTSTENWHPFYCNDYVYIVLDQWVLIFAHLELSKEFENKDDSSVVYVELAVMHRNTMFVCGDDEKRENSTVRIPPYPSRVVQTLTSDGSIWAPIFIVIVLVVIGISFVILVLVRKRRRQQRSQKFSDSRFKKRTKKRAVKTKSFSTVSISTTDTTTSTSDDSTSKSKSSSITTTTTNVKSKTNQSKLNNQKKSKLRDKVTKSKSGK